MKQQNKFINFWAIIIALLMVPALPSCAQKKEHDKPQKQQTVKKQLPPYKRTNIEITKSSRNMKDTVNKTDAEWKQILTPEEYRIMREKGTERAFSNKYWDNKEKGVYKCAACGLDLFSSETKFESGTGWPSFYKPIEPDRVKEIVDKSMGMVRTEVVCARCHSHLGHVFDDGPKPTGLRYCLNSVALDFEKK